MWWQRLVTGFWREDFFALWGFLTGVFSMVLIVGSALIWLPCAIYLFAIDKTGKAIGLLLLYATLTDLQYPDYVVRLTLRKFMDVHPVITVFGVIVGLGLFGFWGVIFGPLLISYFVILIRIYMNEFGKPAGSSQ